ncbi:beta-N-acetylhexosaminidase [Streptococcus pneumoniae]|nr:beta-N-acetylhexosaminidase [Streptococcus pneumoniae]CWK49000.1 beta-N-acetylhexosaminidase [Streptococcus pneumoniae]
MKHEKQQRFSIRKYAVGAASVLIGFAFQAQTVAADGVTPTTTENQPTIHTVSDSLQSSENRTEETPKAELQPEAPKTVETKTPTSAEKETANKKAEEASPKKEEAKEVDSKESNTDKTDKDKPAKKDEAKAELTNRKQRQERNVLQL